MKFNGNLQKALNRLEDVVQCLKADDSEGHWVTTSNGNHLFIDGEGRARTGPGGKHIPSPKIAKKVASFTEGIKGIADPEKQTNLANIVENTKSSGMEILDFMGAHCGGYTEREWDTLVDGKRTGPLVTKRDVESKLKVLKSATNIFRKRNK